MKDLLKETALLDFSNLKIRELIEKNRWHNLEPLVQIRKIYLFVRDEIAFGYNEDDLIPASKVLKDGYGQCNTKATLFMALLRAVGIPCRLHGFTINKKLQKGAMTGIVYIAAPQEIIHSWVEVYYDGIWYNLEGFILDMPYLNALQQKFSLNKGSFCGCGVATNNFKNPVVDFNMNDTYIQKEGIVQDFGLINSPDEFFAEHTQRISNFKRILFKNYGRHKMNENVAKIREENNIGTNNVSDKESA